MANTMDQELYQYFMQLSEAEKKSVLQMLKTFVKGRKPPSKRISIEKYNQELEESERQIEAGHFTTQEELKREWKNGSV